MNKQDKGNGSQGIEWTDYTWNPIGGCLHGCAWTMPDWSVANCYAEDVATRLAQKAYPQGFEHHYWRPEQLDEPLKLKTPSRIFVGSMADVFGHWVPDEQIRQVLDVCRHAPGHSFQFLTKNPKRLLQFDFPENCWIGISAPPSFFMGKELKPHQQYAMLDVLKNVLVRLEGRVRWLSLEPLSWDIGEYLFITYPHEYPPNFEWVVIGAATNGAKVYQPDPAWVNKLTQHLLKWNIPVFFKGNLAGNPAAVPWRAEFPTWEPRQVSMFTVERDRRFMEL